MSAPDKKKRSEVIKPTNPAAKSAKIVKTAVADEPKPADPVPVPKAASPTIKVAPAVKAAPTAKAAPKKAVAKAAAPKKAVAKAGKIATSATASALHVDETSAEIETIRDGVREILSSAILKLVDGAFRKNDRDVRPVAEIAKQLEQQILEVSAGFADTCTHRRAYTDVRLAVSRCLTHQVDICPDDVVGLMLLEGTYSVADVVGWAAASVARARGGDTVPTAAISGSAGATPAVTTAIPAADAELGPRVIVRRMLARTLMEADAHFAGDRDRAAGAALAIELSCYNAAVRQSKQSEAPPRRQWDSPAFVDIYSTRCGVVCGILDLTSASARFGRGVVDRLVRGELQPEALGEMTERELCPEATEAERREISERSRQRVTEKESTMFQCPHCGERRSTFREVQRRSLDEAPDYICMCLNPSCRRRFTGRQ